MIVYNVLCPVTFGRCIAGGLSHAGRILYLIGKTSYGNWQSNQGYKETKELYNKMISMTR